MLELVVLIVGTTILSRTILGWEWKTILAGCIGIAVVHLITYPVMKNIEVKDIDKFK